MIWKSQAFKLFRVYSWRGFEEAGFFLSFSSLLRLSKSSSFLHSTVLPWCMVPPQTQSNRTIRYGWRQPNCKRKWTLPLSEVCIHLDECLCAWRYHRLTSDVLVSHSPPSFLREVLLLNLEFIELVGWLIRDPQFLLHPHRVKYNCIYRWVPRLWICTQVLMLTWQALYRLKHLLAPKCIVISGSF